MISICFFGQQDPKFRDQNWRQPACLLKAIATIDGQHTWVYEFYKVYRLSETDIEIVGQLREDYETRCGQSGTLHELLREGEDHVQFDQSSDARRKY